MPNRLLDSVPFRTLFVLLVTVMAILMPWVSKDYGITFDDPVHNRHGKIILEYFLGNSDMASHSPVPAPGTELLHPTEANPPDHPAWRSMNQFGGLFDLICAIGFKLFPSIGEFELRRMVGSLFGVMAAVFTGLLAKEIAGWRAGFLALLFFAVSPRLFGESMNNPKDLPFAAMYVLGLYQIHLYQKHFPKVTLKHAVGVAACISLAMNVRIGGLLLIPYLWMITGASLMIQKFQLRDLRLRLLFKPVGITLLVGVAGYLGASVLWPWGRTNPIQAPLIALRMASQFDYFMPKSLFNGVWVTRWTIPWSYLPVWIGATLPPALALGLLISPLGFIAARRERASMLGLALLAFALLFPPTYATLIRANFYDGFRHFLFVLPPLIIVCAVGWDALLTRFHKLPLKALATAVLCLALAEPLHFMLVHHPYQGFYFSPFIGGGKGAFRKFEIDYWGGTLNTGVDWILRNIPPGTPENPVRVRAYYGVDASVSYFLDRHPGYKYVVGSTHKPNWDYHLLLPAGAKHHPAWLEYWPPEHTVHSIDADGAPILAVIRNPLTTSYRLDWETQAAEARVRLSPAASTFIELSLLHYRGGQYQRSLEAAQEAIRLDPRNAVAHNNVGSALEGLGRMKEAVEYYRKAVDLNPSFEWAKRNLARVQQELKPAQ